MTENSRDRADDRPDPIAGIMDVTREAESRERNRDKLLGSRLVIGRSYLVAAALIVVLALCLVLPHSEGVRGLDVLLATRTAQEQETSLPSHVFVLIYTIGSVGFGVAMVLTQRWWAAGIAWCASCVATVYGLLAIWLRQSGRGPDPDFQGFGGPGIGLYLSEAVVFLLAIALSVVLWSRTPEQRRLQDQLRGNGY